MSEWTANYPSEHGSRSQSSGRLPESLNNYLRWHRIEGHTALTIRHYQAELGRFVGALEADGHSLQIGDLTSIDILGHLEGMKERELAPKTIDTRLRAIKAWCKWMLDWEIITSNPSAVLKSPRVPKEGKGFITAEQFRATLELCPLNTFLGSRRAAMVWIFATTGMRQSELHSLQLSDLDWDRSIIHIRKGKGQKERWVPFAREAQRAALRYLNHRTDSHPHLWISEKGRKPIGLPSSVGFDMYKLLSMAGVQVKDPCHAWRRTWAANAEKQGIPRPYIQAVAGWTTPAMVDRYVKAMQEGGEAVEAFRDYRVV